MRLRQKRGGTLALVAAATITLILLGICFFFLAQIFGGEREIQHATDSGNLNVAKNALRHPTVTLSGQETILFGQLGDRSLVNNAPPPTVAPVNLLTYDRLFAACLLTCINAQADGNPQGISNAGTMVQVLQSGPNSIGGRLSAELSKKSGNELFNNFGETANQNSLRMLGANSTLSHTDQDFQVSYLEQTGSDIGATNIEVLPAVRNLFPAGLQSALFTTKKTANGTTTYIRGYVSPSIGSSGTPVGVPLQPGDQPHLVSNKTFSQQTSRGGSFVNAMVPPNGFRSHTSAGEERTAQNATTLSCAEVGSLNMSFPLSIPYGYIKIVNGPDGGGAASVPGPFAGLDHVLNNELLNPGIFVAGPVFSDNLGLEQDWARYNKAKADGANPMPPKPSTNGLYNLQGQPATEADAAQIPYSSSGSLVMTQCTDDNSTGWSRSDADVVPQCWDLLGNGSGPGAFDKAFHPNAQYSEASAGATDLLSVECAKCQLQHKFNACGSLSISNANCAVTGLRTFQKGVELPSASMGSCKISNENTLSALADFVSSGFGSQLMTLIADRCNQIKPTDDNNNGIPDGGEQARALLSGKTWRLGEVAYLYAPQPDNGQTNLVLSSSPPGWANASTQPDGTPLPKRSGTYNLNQTLVNPHHDGGIHDIMYREHPGGGINAEDTVTWTPSSGFQNLLGKVQFTNSASGTASGFCKPD